MKYVALALPVVIIAIVAIWLIRARQASRVAPSPWQEGAATDGDQHPAALDYHASCKVLQRLKYLAPDQVPPLPDHRPLYDDDEPLGVSFFRTQLADESLEHLTLPRTFFGKSEVLKTSFKDTNFSDSNLSWNDFIDVDFTAADLSKSDLRASHFVRVSFCDTNLRGADLRRSTFDDCDFSNATLHGAN